LYPISQFLFLFFFPVHAVVSNALVSRLLRLHQRSVFSVQRIVDGNFPGHFFILVDPSEGLKKKKKKKNGAHMLPGRFHAADLTFHTDLTCSTDRTPTERVTVNKSMMTTEDRFQQQQNGAMMRKGVTAHRL
jgi:hypothetical protein